MPTSQHTYDEAAALFSAGRYDRAATLLQQLVGSQPDNVEYRHALAMCRINQGQFDDATAHLRLIVAAEPGRRDDTYILACLLERQGHHDEAARTLGAVTVDEPGYRDVQQRLARHDVAVPSTRPVIVIEELPEVITASGRPLPRGVLSGRRIADDYGVGDPGDVQQVCHQKIRHHLPTILGSIAVAILATLAVVMLPRIVHGLPDAITQPFTLPPSITPYLPLLAGLLLLGSWLRAAGLITWRVVEARCYTVTVHQRGLDVASGVFRRQKRFIWLYQVVEDPQYQQTFVTYLCRTASLSLHYSDSPSTTQEITLEGIGSPTEVDGLRAYLKSRRFPERAAAKNFTI